MTDRDILINIGLESNVKELEKQFKDADLDNKIHELAVAAESFDKLLKRIGTNLQSAFGDTSGITTNLELFKKMRDVVKSLGYELEHGSNKYKMAFKDNAFGIPYDPMSFSTIESISYKGDYTESDHLSAFAKSKGFTDIASARAAMTEMATFGGGIDTLLGGRTADKNISKEEFKENLVDYAKELTVIGDEKLTKLKDALSDNIENLSVDIDKNGEAVRQSFKVQIDDYDNFIINLERVTKTINGIEEKFWTRTSQKFNFNPEQRRADEQKTAKTKVDEEVNGINRLIKAHGNLLKEKNKLSVDAESNSNYLKVTEESIESNVKALENYGIKVSQTGELSLKGFNSATKGLDKNSEAFKTLTEAEAQHNAEVKKSNAQFADKTQKKDIDDYIQKLKRLYDAKLKVQKLKFAKAKDSSILEAEKDVEKLSDALKIYKDTDIPTAKRATDAYDEVNRKFNATLRELENNLNRTGTSFGSIAKKIKESARNTVIYGVLYKGFSLATGAIRDSINEIKELDKISTELQMVTGETDSQTKALINTYSEMGKQLGATTKQVAEGSVEWL